MLYKILLTCLSLFSFLFIKAQDKAKLRSIDSLIKIYQKENNIPKVIELNKEKVVTLESSLSKDLDAIAKAYVNLANVYEDERKANLSIENLEKAIFYFEKNNSSKLELGSAYINKAFSYYISYRNEKAIFNFKKALSILKPIKTKESEFRILSVLNGLGLANHNSSKYDIALEYLDKAHNKIIKEFPDDIRELQQNYSNKGRVYYDKKDLDKSLFYFKKAYDLKKIFLKKKKLSNFYLNYNLNQIGRVYMTKNDYKKALEYHLEAFKLAKENNRLKDFRSIGTLLEISRDYIKLEDPVNAKLYLDKVPELIGYDESKKFDFNNIREFTKTKNYLQTKTNYYFLYLNWNKSYLDSIISNDQVIMKLLDYKYNILNSQKNRSESIEKFHFIYERSIEHLTRKEDLNQPKAFEISEKIKSRQILETFNNSKASSFGKVPDSLVQKESILNKKIALLEKKQYESKQIKNDSLIILYEEQIFNLNREKEKLFETFKVDYPNYHQLKYNHEVASVEEIQAILQPNQTLVEYFVGDKNIFIYTISNNDFKIKQLSKDFPLEKWVTQMRNSIYDYNKKSKDYTAAAYNLYNKLLKPIEAELQHQLIIIPDGVLNYVPFEALLTEQVKETSNYKNLPYFIKQHQISYNYSATLFKQLLEKENIEAKKDLLAFAPEFSGNQEEFSSISARRKGFANLQHNIPEVKSINNLIEGNLFIGDQATEANFNKHAKDYKIIHLSTHGKSNDALGDYSFIAFSKVNDSIQDQNRLYVRELYNMNLNADMAVLSACETGLGELKRGEGIIGLARAFTYAGAKSTINSLWSVDDAKTKKLMELFYTNIKDGMAKDEALHKAKLSYLETEFDTAPYYWASFIPAGNMEPINLNKEFNYWWLAAIGIIGIGFILFRKKKKAA